MLLDFPRWKKHATASVFVGLPFRNAEVELGSWVPLDDSHRRKKEKHSLRQIYLARKMHSRKILRKCCRLFPKGRKILIWIFQNRIGCEIDYFRFSFPAIFSHVTITTRCRSHFPEVPLRKLRRERMRARDREETVKRKQKPD